MSPRTDLDEAVALAMDTARLSALIEAEAAVLALKTNTMWASQIKTIDRAAQAIQKLKGTQWIGE